MNYVLKPNAAVLLKTALAVDFLFLMGELISVKTCSLGSADMKLFVKAIYSVAATLPASFFLKVLLILITRLMYLVNPPQACPHFGKKVQKRHKNPIMTSSLRLYAEVRDSGRCEKSTSRTGWG